MDRVRVKPHIPVADLQQYKLLERGAEYLFAKALTVVNFISFTLWLSEEGCRLFIWFGRVAGLSLS